MTKEKKRKGKLPRVIFGILLAILICIIGAFLVLTLTEYKPKEVENIVPPSGKKLLSKEAPVTIVTFNTGYAALGENADFFMDGGKTTRPDSAEEVKNNLLGISETIKGLDADIILLQEVDTSSRRSYNMDQTAYYAEALGLPFDFAYNYSAAFVPYPIAHPLGKVNSGLAVYTKYAVASAQRVQLPVPFKWPVRCFNLKRCLLVNRMPIEGSDKELVVVNLHLEAYDDGEGKIAQTKQLYDFIAAEYSKGNYVIAGGDFNQTFPGAMQFPVIKEGNWMPGTLDAALPEGFSFAIDEDQPTCRLLDVPYKGNETPQFYIIDGFIVSSNIRVESVETVETNFVNSDHQPVKLVFRFE
ncbi:MAG: endonuclease [Clostridia bacterium]|nr:endonuclease [Clostridia bacterium]